MASSLREAIERLAHFPSVWSERTFMDGRESYLDLDAGLVPAWAESVQATLYEKDGCVGLYVCAWPKRTRGWPTEEAAKDVHALFRVQMQPGSTGAHFAAFGPVQEPAREEVVAHSTVLDAPRDSREYFDAMAHLRALQQRAPLPNLERVQQLQREIDELLAVDVDKER